MKNLYKIEDELYIISSSEKIKENTQSFKEGLNGDWFYNTIYNFMARTGDITPYDFKIILTTNNLLIKDGVQAIDDEFLEWFVKNPSCEFVEIKIWFDTSHISLGIGRVYHNNPNKPLYKIIIPKEEPKQEHNKYLSCCRSKEECHCKEEPKQETGKEVADYIDRHIVEVLVEVAKQKMYSEEDMKLAFETGRNFQLTGEDNFNELIEKLKK